MDTSTGVSTVILILFIGVIIIHFLFAVIHRNDGKNIKRSEIAVSFGVLGTFLGIVIGLFWFDVNDIQGSIPQLLEGLKIAFATSIAGMVSSICIKSFPESADGNDSEVTPEMIRNELRAINEGINVVNQQNIDDSKKIRINIQSLKGELTKVISGENDTSLVNQVKLLKTDLIEQLNKNKDLNKSGFEILHQKISEFGESIAKLSSEAMVDALKQAIVEFNKSLADHLDDNFKQLNEGVKNLLEWQNKYKDTINHMQVSIESTITQLGQATSAIEGISKSLDPIPNIVESIDKLFKNTENAIGLLYNTLESFKDMKEKATEAFPLIEDNLKKLTDDFTQKAIVVSETINESSINLTESVKLNNQQINNFVNESTENLNRTYNTLSDSISSSTKKYSEDIESIIKGTSSKMNETLTNSYDKINSNLDTAGQKSGELITKTIEGLDQSMQQELRRSLEVLGSGLASLSNKFVEDYKPLTQKLNDLIRISEQMQSQNINK